MLCEKCKKNEATVFYRENVNGKETKYSLCAHCAAELEKSGKLSFASDPLLGGFFTSPEPIDSLFSSLFAPAFALTAGDTVKKRCALCKSTFEDIVEAGKVGCPQCYEEFRAELEPTLRRIHGKTKHTGGAPAKLRDKIDKMKRIASLESEMKDAVKNQEFERAAELRDTLRELRGDSN